MIKEPEWYKYLLWDMSDPSFPVAKGFKPDTPKEMIEQYKKDKKEYEKVQKANPYADII